MSRRVTDRPSQATGSVCLIVLAAGLSTRMGSRDKLQLPLGDATVLEHAVGAAVDAGVGDVVVVTGAQDYRPLLEGTRVRHVRNPHYEEGMASSIRAGIESCGREASAFGIVLGDMPFIRPATIEHLAEHLRPEAIVVPHFHGVPGHPVFFGARYRRELLALRGDAGARSVIGAHDLAVVRVETDDPGVLGDIDTEEAYRAARGED